MDFNKILTIIDEAVGKGWDYFEMGQEVESHLLDRTNLVLQINYKNGTSCKRRINPKQLEKKGGLDKLNSSSFVKAFDSVKKKADVEIKIKEAKTADDLVEHLYAKTDKGRTKIV